MKKEILTVIIIIALVIAFFSGSYYVKYQAKKETRLINQGFQETAIQITQTGNIPVIVNSSIQWFPIRNFCEG